MAHTDIYTLLTRLIDKTRQGQCKWQEESSGMRLFLKSGSILFKYSYDEMVNGYEFSIRLFDTTEQFAYYYTDCADSFDEKLYTSMDLLRVAIKSWQTMEINKKINILYGELE